MRVALLAVALLACAHSSQPAPASSKSQPAQTEIPAAAGAASSQLPAEVTKPPPPRPQAESVQAPAATNAGPLGKIVGQAWYAGPACTESSWPPRCNGPYRRTQVAIWSHSRSGWLRNSITGDDGRFWFDIEPGWYTIVLVTGSEQTPYWFAKVNVPPLETVTQNLVVDFGQR